MQKRKDGDLEFYGCKIQKVQTTEEEEKEYKRGDFSRRKANKWKKGGWEHIKLNQLYRLGIMKGVLSSN